MRRFGVDFRGYRSDERRDVDCCRSVGDWCVAEDEESGCWGVEGRFCERSLWISSSYCAQRRMASVALALRSVIMDSRSAIFCCALSKSALVSDVEKPQLGQQAAPVKDVVAVDEAIVSTVVAVIFRKNTRFARRSCAAGEQVW